MLQQKHEKGLDVSESSKNTVQFKFSYTILSSIASVSVALILVVIKALAVNSSGSNAVLASMADSALDLIASAVTLLSVRYAQTAPDKEHRYGHGKAEALAGVFQAGLVAISCALIGLSSIDRIIHPRPLNIEGPAIVVMIISIFLTMALVAFQSWTLKKTNSIATKGDRAHYLSDLLSNLVGLVGVWVAAKFHILQADALAGLFIAAWLLIGAWHIASEAADHLLDKEAPEETRNQIKAIVHSNEYGASLHDLRTRISGPWLHIQFHMELPKDMKLLDAHDIIVDIEKKIRDEFPDSDIIIHPDPDEGAEPHGHPKFGLK